MPASWLITIALPPRPTLHGIAMNIANACIAKLYERSGTCAVHAGLGRQQA